MKQQPRQTRPKPAPQPPHGQSVNPQLAALKGMGPAALRERYLAVFGEASRTGNKDYLFKRLAWRIQSLAEGGLSDRARRRAEELARDADIRTTAPKAATAGTSGMTISPASAPRPSAHDRLPIPGTVLTREYRGQHIAVTVLSDGFEYQGQRYRSLSAIAKAITGSHWNGLLFFGLTTPKRKQP